jgi:hypothetical protein
LRERTKGLLLTKGYDDEVKISWLVILLIFVYEINKEMFIKTSKQTQLYKFCLVKKENVYEMKRKNGLVNLRMNEIIVR